MAAYFIQILFAELIQVIETVGNEIFLTLQLIELCMSLSRNEEEVPFRETDLTHTQPKTMMVDEWWLCRLEEDKHRVGRATPEHQIPGPLDVAGDRRRPHQPAKVQTAG